MSKALPTMTDIAHRSGFSKNTVSLALRNDSRLPATTRLRIQKIAAKLGYRKNPVVAHLMVQLRANRLPLTQPKLALVNANLDAEAFTRHPTIPVYIEGCRQRAWELGYQFDEFWLHDPELNGQRLNRILRARNIPGLLVVGLMNDNHLPPRFLSTWEAFPAVVTGVRTRNPALSFACTDHHMLALRAVEQAWTLGYRLPALVVDEAIESLVEGRFSSGFQTALHQLKSKRIIQPFFQVEAARSKPELFKKWMRHEKPDVILTLYHVVERWLKDMDLRIPDDIGLIQLERRANQPKVSGMDQHNKVVGTSAVEMLVSMIHNNESGVPSYPRATLIGSSWVQGESTAVQPAINK